MILKPVNSLFETTFLLIYYITRILTVWHSRWSELNSNDSFIIQRSKKITWEGVDWLGGEFYGKDGAPVMRYARAIGIPHVVWSSQANLAWDYLKHFRRDQDTGESIYDPVICWGER